MINPEQIRAARALLRIEQGELARRAHVSATTIRRIEAVGGLEHVSEETIGGIRRALEQAGAEFIENGVRRRVVGHDPEARYRTLRAIAERSAGLQEGGGQFTDHDLYDDDGLPG
jgi:predicted transcriptional regulator